MVRRLSVAGDEQTMSRTDSPSATLAERVSAGSTPRVLLTEAGLLLVGIPVFLWTMMPIYHMVLFAISSKDSAMNGRLWPDDPTLQNFRMVFHQQHHYLEYFWSQLWSSTSLRSRSAR